MPHPLQTPARMPETSAAVAQDAVGSLPQWDLSDLFPGPDSPKLQETLLEVEGLSQSFAADYRGTIIDLDSAAFGTAMARYEQIQEIFGRVMSFAHLLYAGDQNDPKKGKFFQDMQEKINALATDILFFCLEINRLSDDVLAAKLADPAAARYQPWLRDLRVFKPHELSDDVERLLHEKQVCGRAAWIRLFDETMAGLRFPFGDDLLTEAEILHHMTDRDPETRRQAAQSLGRVLGENIRLLAHITNTLAKDKEIEDQWRSYPHPWSAKNKMNQVEDAVVEALVEAVRESFPRLSHRYYALKAQWFGVEALDYWDRNAPLKEEDNRIIAWPEAQTRVLAAYADFSPELAAVGQRFFDSAWIDAPPRPGKASGAFAHPTVPSCHPYLLLNYQGRVRDVMTLAHELGHGCHQYLAGQQGYLMADTPLTLAETASVFGEMLTFRMVLADAPDEKSRRVMLANKVEDMLNTVVRQVAMYGFERRLHSQRRHGELSVEALGDIWLETQGESLGPAIKLTGDYRHFWAYVPHFVHSPFYVYAYAFGDCLVNSLYMVYQEGEKGFAEKYLEMLRAGGVKRHRELLAPFGLDAADPAFWKRGLGVIEGFIDELEGTTTK